MDVDLLDLYGRASEWTLDKVAGATGSSMRRPPATTGTYARLLNHMLDTQHYFVASARGEDAKLPSPTPPKLLGRRSRSRLRAGSRRDLAHVR